MPGVPAELPYSGRSSPDLLSQASAILAREASRIPTAAYGASGPNASGVTPAAGIAAPYGMAGRKCPVTGATVLHGRPGNEALLQQAHELLGALYAAMGRAPGGSRMPVPGADPSTTLPAAALGNDIHGLVGLLPITGTSLPGVGPDIDQVRRQAHELIESLLVTFSQATGEKAAPYEEEVPLIRCVAPVQSGGEGRVTMRVANEEDTPSEVALYCTNFVADSGYEIPSLRVTVSPRRVTIPAKGHADFEIKIAVPQQAPAAIYSGLIQAMGSKYVKAVLSVEVQ